MNYFRIQYLRRGLHNEAALDSYVVSTHQNLEGLAQEVLTYGFNRKNGEHAIYDGAERIMPGAIMSITPCNERGWSEHDLAQEKDQREREGRSRRAGTLCSTLAGELITPKEAARRVSAYLREELAKPRRTLPPAWEPGR